MSENQKRDGGNRWWEYYFLRYFVGTVAGAVIVAFLFRSPSSSLYNSDLSVTKDFGGFGIKEISGLAALGFAYCYAASAPMLLLHATRSQFGRYSTRARWAFWLVTAAVTVVAYFLVARWMSLGWWGRQGAALFLFLVIFLVQIAKIVSAHIDRLKTIGDFYRSLAKVRAMDAPWVSEYVESYRHLREHGNAVSILVLEIVLGFVLLSARGLASAVAIVVLWLLPSAYSWLIGSALEANIVHTPKE
jgi:hypothetical protein